MAREVVVYTLCDVCLERDDVRTDGIEVNLALEELGMTKPRSLVLCEVHRKEFYEPLLEVVKTFGQKAGVEAKPVKATKSKAKPKAEPKEATVTEPDLFVEAESEGPGPIGDSEATCEECGKVYSHELGNNRPKQALGVHLARVHGIMAADRRAATTN